MERKEKALVILWGLGMLYALFASLYTTLFGCGCPDLSAMGDCHAAHLPEILGAVGWMLLVPAGIWLFRRRKEILQVFGTYIGATLACSGLWLIETIRRASGVPFRYSPGSLGRILMIPVHGLCGSGGLPERWWLVLVLCWTLVLWGFSGVLEKKYHPRTEKIRITFDGVYKFAYVLLGVVHLLFTAEALDQLVVSNPDRLPEGLYIAVTALWLAVMAGGAVPCPQYRPSRRRYFFPCGKRLVPDPLSASWLHQSHAAAGGTVLESAVLWAAGGSDLLYGAGAGVCCNGARMASVPA